MELFAIMVGDVEHPYWRPRSFVALVDSDWGPSPVLQVANVPYVFLTRTEAQDVIDEYSNGIEMKVMTFTCSQTG